jgi:putative methionine-R-sulfoxide reductase with GAF domain
MPGDESRSGLRFRWDLLCSALTWGSTALLGMLLALLASGTIAVAAPFPRAILGISLGALFASSLGMLALRYCASGRRERRAPANAAPSRLSSQPLDYLVSLLNVSRAVGNEVTLEDLGQVIVDSCRDSFDCDEVSLMFLEPGGTHLAVRAFAGHRDTAKVRNARVALGEGVAGTVAKTRTPLILGPTFDSRKFPGFQAKTRRIASSMVAPVVVRNRVIGVLNASTSNPETTYSEDDLRVLCILAEHAGIAAAKARDAERFLRVVRRMRRRQRRQAERLNRVERDERRVA